MIFRQGGLSIQECFSLVTLQGRRNHAEIGPWPIQPDKSGFGHRRVGYYPNAGTFPLVLFTVFLLSAIRKISRISDEYYLMVHKRVVTPLK